LITDAPIATSNEKVEYSKSEWLKRRYLRSETMKMNAAQL